MEVDGITWKTTWLYQQGVPSTSIVSQSLCGPCRGAHPRAGGRGRVFFAGLDEHCGGVRGPDGEIPKPGEHVWV